MSIHLPTRLLATKAEIEQAKNGSNPALCAQYIEALEEIALAAIALWDTEELGTAEQNEWNLLEDALKKVYILP